VRLLLDEMYDPAIAHQLRVRGHDVQSVGERHDLVGQSDADVFAVAEREQRAVMTENVQDFVPLARTWQQREPHWGLLLTTNRRHPRAQSATLGRLVRAVDALLSEASPSRPSSREWWLP
jgi:predicted nuclease of predicted toxin-antitoxin system